MDACVKGAKQYYGTYCAFRPLYEFDVLARVQVQVQCVTGREQEVVVAVFSLCSPGLVHSHLMVALARSMR